VVKHNRAGRTAPEGEHVRCQGELAAALGIHERSIRKLLSQGAPARTSAGYPVDAWRAWRAARRAPHELAAADRIAREEGERRLTVAKALREERRNLIESGQYVPGNQVSEAVCRVGRMFIGVLDRAGPELAVLLAGVGPGKVRVVVDGWVHNRRIELVNTIRAEKRQGLSTENADDVGAVG